MFANIKHIHFVGIGGIGMSGIAEILLDLGYRVSGSDVKLSSVTDHLQQRGAIIFENHKPAHLGDAEVVVISSAVSANNSEVAAARKRQIPVIQRAEMLAELMRLKYGIAVAGMHGKTTTTSMIATVLAAGGLDPTVAVGGRVESLGSNARSGKSKYMVVEADESDRSFLKLSPILAVVTNVDREHMDCYGDMAAVEQAFVDFVERVPFYGTAIVCNDDDRLRALLPRMKRRVVTYGRREGSDFHITAAVTISPAGQGPSLPGFEFEIQYHKTRLGKFRLNVPGAHNLLNATAAIAVGIGLGLSAEQVALGLEDFRGVDRRFHLRGSREGITVIDDYGHHPSEIRATLAAAKQCGFRRVHVIFQPHRYTRTRDLMEDFGTAFDDVDTLLVLDIYAASEVPIPDISGEKLAKVIRKAGNPTATYIPSFAAAVEAAVARAQPGDMILTMGAGNVSQLVPMVLEALAARDLPASSRRT